MRLWSLHPSSLDQKALSACWREGLLAQKVLQGLTKGYKNHPQLNRFRQMPEPLTALCTYLHAVVDEAEKRGYKFNRDLIVVAPESCPMTVTSGQIEYECDWLRTKVERRQPNWLPKLKTRPHPMFQVVPGPIENWEIQKCLLGV